MPKVYAILEPATHYTGFADADFGKFLIEGFHALRYEQICNYSLGHNASFFSSLDKAKDNLGVKRIKEESLRLFGHMKAQDAIVELEVNDNNEITGFNRIYTINNFEKIYEKPDENVDYYKELYNPIWKERSISLKDGTSGALNEINKQYQAHLANIETLQPNLS